MRKMQKKTSVLTSVCIAFAALAVTAASADASLLVYEGFAGYGTSGNISGKTVDASTVGLTGSYSTYYLGWGLTDGSEQKATLTGGLSLGSNFSSAAGSSALYLWARNTNRIPTVGVQLTSSAAGAVATGTTVYSSLLFKLNTNSSFGGSLLQQRISSAKNSGSGVLGISPDSTSGTQPGVGYTGNGTATSYTLTTGTTYLMVAKYTNVGGAGGGSATLWVLDQAAYDNWFAAGHTEATIDSYALATATHNSTSTVNFDGYLQFALATGFPPYEAPTHAGTFDELRYATTLNESVGLPVPEPASLSVFVAAAAFIGCVHRRR